MGCVGSKPADSPGGGTASAASKYLANEQQGLPSINGNRVPGEQGIPSVTNTGAGGLQGSLVAAVSNPSLNGKKDKAAVPDRHSSESKRISFQLQPNITAAPRASGDKGAVNTSLKSLTQPESQAVQNTLLKVSLLIQKLAEGRSEKTTPVQALRRALDLITADSHATYASVQALHESMDSALMVALTGAPDNFLETNRLQRLGQSGTAAEVLIASKAEILSWDPSTGDQLPTDWHKLVAGAGLRHLTAVPIRANERVIGILTLGFNEENEHHASHSLFPTYMQLVASSLTSVVKDGAVPKYLTLVKEMYLVNDVDAVVHLVVTHMRGVLGHTNNHHMWYRIALTGASNMAATIFDDLTQVPTSLMQRGLSGHQGSRSQKLFKEVQAAGGVMRTTVPMKSTVMKISVHNRQQVMIPDVQKLINQSGNVSVDIFNTRLIKPPTSVLVFPLKVKQHIFGVVFCMSSVATDFADVSPRLRELCEIISPHLLGLLNTSLATEYTAVQNALPNTPEGGSMSGLLMSHSRNASFSGRSMGGTLEMGNSISASQESFVFTQSRSSTGALVTGLTEKLNQKRIKSSMDFAGTQALGDLQVTALLGEGGFAKVFKGLWRGLVVGVKVVCDDGKNEKMVMKNAHEIAILGGLSHPNIIQAYICLTDVAVRDLLGCSFRNSPPNVLSSLAYKYLAGMEERPCHVEVIDYCDLGNLSTALKYAVFQVPNPDKVLAAAAGIAQRDEGGENGAVSAEAAAASKALLAEVRAQAGHVHMRTLLLTLIEIASAMSHLHRMGVVHCDIKPANILLKSSSADARGFIAKVSDFGLSRVEDDDTHASFPFNSCGTAAYVAPEALICNKKVNSSVDVYAFGILMWEMYTGARPYGNMKQQTLVEEVVMRGLRPRFPSHTPPSYVLLAQACWSGSAQARPTFDEALTTLNGMLTALDEREMGSTASASFASNAEVVEYMAANSAAAGAPAGASAYTASRQQLQRSQSGAGSADGRRSPGPGHIDVNGGANGVSAGYAGRSARGSYGSGLPSPTGGPVDTYGSGVPSAPSSGQGSGGAVRRSVSRKGSLNGEMPHPNGAPRHDHFPAQPSGLSAMTDAHSPRPAMG